MVFQNIGSWICLVKKQLAAVDVRASRPFNARKTGSCSQQRPNREVSVCVCVVTFRSAPCAFRSQRSVYRHWSSVCQVRSGCEAVKVLRFSGDHGLRSSRLSGVSWCGGLVTYTLVPFVGLLFFSRAELESYAQSLSGHSSWWRRGLFFVCVEWLLTYM